MSLEVELKLQLLAEKGPDQLDWFTHHPYCQHKSRSLVKNTYFDTPSLALVNARIALRIREIEGCFFQTLKTKGASVGGLHQRGEWEYSIPDDHLEKSLLPDDVWPQDIDIEDLAAAFNTDFERNKWLWQDESGNTIEVVHDTGRVTSPNGGIDQINELELELLEGDPDAIFALAQAIVSDLPCVLSDVTKAQRGYQLFAKDAWQAQTYQWNPENVVSQLEYIIHGLSSEQSISDQIWQKLSDLVAQDLSHDLWIRSCCLKGCEYIEQHASLRGALLITLAHRAWTLSKP